MPKPILSIIVLSYNTAAITVNCLKSILKDKGLKSLAYEIIVIDNASTDDSISKINSLDIKNLTQVVNKKNLGFAQGNNQAAKLAQGNYLLFLNSDTIILHSSISQTLDWLASHPESSACTGQLLNPDHSLQPTGGYFPNLLNTLAWYLHLDDLPGFNQLILPLHPHPPQFYTRDRFYLFNRQLDSITAAFFLIRRSHFQALNGFSRHYFMYGEEVELCYRLKARFPQTQIWYLIGPQIIHLANASSSPANALAKERAGIEEEALAK